MSNATEIFAAMSEAVQSPSGKDLQKKFKGIVVFKISSNDAAVKEKKWILNLSNSSTRFVKPLGSNEPNPKADLVVMVSEENMIKLMNKKLNPQQAFMKGKLKIKGKMNLAMKLTTVLAAARKTLPPQSSNL